MPEEKIRERRTRSLEQLPWFLDKADQALIFDNSGATPRAVAEKSAGVIWLDPAAPAAIAEAVAQAGSP